MSYPTLSKKSHLASDEHEISSLEFEWGLLRFHEAFERFCLQIASISGMGALAYEDVVILHVVRMHDRPKPVTIIARLLNRDDIPNIQYSLRKLASLGYIRKIKEEQSKNYVYEMTDEGRIKSDYYGRIRQELLSNQTSHIDKVDDKQAAAARLVSILTGIYDEAGRIAATYAPPIEDSVTQSDVTLRKPPSTSGKAASGRKKKGSSAE